MDTVGELSEIKNELNTVKLLLKKTQAELNELKNKDRICSNPADRVDISVLQTIQDGFSDAVGLACIVADADGNPLTRPSNFSKFCSLIRESSEGLKNCTCSNSELAKRAYSNGGPVIESYCSCGLMTAGAPIIVGGNFVGVWIIGQKNHAKLNLAAIKSYASALGLSEKKVTKAYEEIGEIPLEIFERIVNLLWIFTKELGTCFHNNMLLTENIEEQKKYENDLIVAKEKAEEGTRLKRSFLSNISHEIRTPLNGILGFVDIITSEQYSPDEKSKIVKIIHQSSDRLLGTIDEIIEISLIDTEQIYLNNTQFLLNDVFERLMQKYRGAAETKGLYLKNNSLPDAQNISIVSDKEKLFSVLENLLKNAIKFTIKGGVSLGFAVEGENVNFYIEDTGVGIKPERIAAIFNSFEQDDINYTRSYEGIGLGLSISKAYVDLLGGKIAVESERENIKAGNSGWSRFSFELPLDNRS